MARKNDTGNPNAPFTHLEKQSLAYQEELLTVTLRRDQWPAVLYGMELAAEVKHTEQRDLAERVFRETRMEIRKQLEAGAVEPTRHMYSDECKCSECTARFNRVLADKILGRGKRGQ